jgi:RNA methyltransferase, TrmH family
MVRGLSTSHPEGRTGYLRADFEGLLTTLCTDRRLSGVLTEQITSKQNPLVRRAQRIRTGAEPGHMFVEGLRLIEEVFEARLSIEALIYTQSFAEDERGSALLSHVARRRCRGAVVPQRIMDAICDVESPQGAVALVVQPHFDLKDLFAAEGPVVLLEGLQDPGNVGTIVRSAEAASAAGVATTAGTAEPYGAKALRASMGSAFRLPIARRVTVEEAIGEARARKIPVLASAANGSIAYSKGDLREPFLLLVGNEGAGLSPEALAAADSTVSIPLAQPVESLNAAIAAAIILFEAARQRG